ncbi:MAG TPA: rhomboid family intramembrane serine protease [bacterium]
MSYDDLGEYRRQIEGHYRLGMQGGWTQGARWTRILLFTLTVLLVVVLIILTRFQNQANNQILVFLNASQVIKGSVWQVLTSAIFLPPVVPPMNWQSIFYLFYLLIFGPKVEREWGSNRFIRFYITSAILASLITLIILLPTRFAASPVSTASAAIFAVMFAYATMWPRDAFFLFGIFPMPMFTVALGLFGLEVLWVFLGQPDAIGSVVGFGIGYIAMKVPAVRSLVLGDVKTQKVTATSRVSRQEHERISPAIPEPASDKKEEPESKKNRTGFLEM